MPRLKHSPALDGAWTHKGEEYRIEDGIIEVDDIELAREMAQHRRLELVDVDKTPTPDAEETGFPTNEDGEPLCVGKEDGQCSRVVDEPGGTCWQH